MYSRNSVLLADGRDVCRNNTHASSPGATGLLYCTSAHHPVVRRNLQAAVQALGIMDRHYMHIVLTSATVSGHFDGPLSVKGRQHRG